MKVLLGQVKSGNIYDAEKYGGDVETLYKNNREEFFKNFGVDQIVTSISLMDDFMRLVDDKLSKSHYYEVYPRIIVNDKAFQTPFMANIFNTRFQELTKGIASTKFTVNPLTLIHINDLERIEELIKETPDNIWELMKYNFKDNSFIPPFYSTIDQIYPQRRFPKRIQDLFEKLITKYENSQ